MASPSPPKPWERSAGATSASVGLTGSSTATPATASSNPPPLPEIPNALTSVANRNATNYSNMNTNRYQSPYNSYGGGYNSYSSPYSRMGGMGGYGSMYGGGMGGMYGGGMGMGMGMGGMYGGGMGMPGDPNNMSLTQSFSQSTQTTFQLIEGIVGAFGGFAQMLESTYMATHSSFFAMVSVAEQFGNLRQTLGSVLGIFTLMRWIRSAIAKLTGRPPPASGKELTPGNFAAFNGIGPDGAPMSKPSKKPFVVFMLAAFGLPYLMGKLIKALARSQEEEEKRRMAENPQAYGAEPIDPNKLEFCRVLYDFTPDANANSVQGLDLAVKKGDMVAVLSKSDPLGNPSEWWRCRSRDGRMGYLPGVYLEVIQRRQPAQITSGSQPVSPAGSRAQTMTSASGTAASRTATMTENQAKVPEKVPMVAGKAGDMGVESFQKGAFYS